MIATKAAAPLATCSLGAIALVLALASPAAADCAKDITGEVYCGGGRCIADREGTIWCASSHGGDVERLQDGTIVCGKGECAKDSRGRVFCSSEKDGAVLIDSSGSVRCYGRCEPASSALCERTKADSSGR